MVDYGQGEADNPTLKFSAGIMTITGILFGTIEISGAHEEGKVTFDGAPEELMDFQAITSVINEYLQNN